MGKSAIITGASRGIGRACAEVFAKNGYSVLALYRENRDKAEELCRELSQSGCKAIPFEADISDNEQIKRAVSKAIYEFGHIDVLVNNAGISLSKTVSDTSEEEYTRLFDVNVKGAYFMSKYVLVNMKENGGSIVNVSSMWGISGASGEVAYAASKGAIVTLTKSLAKEFCLYGIRVNCVAPGVIDTDMNKCYSEETIASLAEKTPLGRIGSPYDVANAVYFLAGENASFITGQTLSVDGGFIL